MSSSHYTEDSLKSLTRNMVVLRVVVKVYRIRGLRYSSVGICLAGNRPRAIDVIRVIKRAR